MAVLSFQFHYFFYLCMTSALGGRVAMRITDVLQIFQFVFPWNSYTITCVNSIISRNNDHHCDQWAARQVT